MSSSVSQLVRQFLEHCELEKGHSTYTIRNYDHYLGRFLIFCDEKKMSQPSNVTLESIRQYRLWLAHADYMKTQAPVGIKAAPMMNVKTTNYHLIALRAFLKYLAKRDIESLAPEKIELADQPARQIQFLEINEIERLLDAPLGQTQKSPSIRARDKALLEVLFSTGLRVSEIASLKRDQVNLGTGEFAVRGKGDKVRVVFLSELAKEWLKKYLDSRHDDNQRIFPITTRQIQRIVNKYARAAGIVKDVHPHTIRHSYATDLLQSGSDLRSVQALLGHSSITTTQIYTHVTNPQLKEVHQAFHARRRGKIDKHLTRRNSAVTLK